MSTVSIVVPVYKVEPYLRECIDSILFQTYTNFDLILVDDGSTDNCGAICDEYSRKDNRINVIHQNNGGLSAARNAGINWVLDNSHSKWITFVDSDDVILENYLKCLHEISKYYQTDVVTCSYQEFSIKPKQTAIATQTKYEEISLLSSVGACIDIYDDSSKCGISAWGKLFRKNLFDEIRFPIGMIHEDQAVVPILLYKASAVAVSQLPLYCYRDRSDSIMHKKFSNRRFDDLEAVNNCIAFFETQNKKEVVRVAERKKRILQARYNLEAIKDGVHDKVPKRFKMSEFSALRLLKKELPDSKNTYQLAQIHPNWIRLHEYIRKTKKMFHIPCK